MNPTAIIGAAHPLIDIDLTVVLQFVLFAIMFVAANTFLFQPYLRLRARRQAGIEGARAEAEQMSSQADGKLADYEHKLAAARAKAAEDGRTIRAEASAYDRDVTAAARTAAMTAIGQAQSKVRAETEAARATLLPQAETLARSMAGKLLGREVA